MTRALWLALAAVIAVPAGSAAPADIEPAGPDDAAVRRAIDQGVDFLVRDQNADGSWGGPQDSITTWSGSMWPNAESHRAWKVATTGLGCAALLQVSEQPDALAAADRSIAFLIANANVKRPTEWDTMNGWAYIYGLQGLVVARRHPRYADSELGRAIDAVVPRYLADLSRHQSISGGWGYLELEPPRTRRMQWGTSFMTAAAVYAIELARDAGYTLDEPMARRAVDIIHHCRLPNGGYTYHIRAIPNLNLEYIDQVKGSLARIQVCQAALVAAGQDIALNDRITGLGHFFKEHRFLDIAVHKPIPHETYYANSGYFYLFGHYYAAQVIAGLPEADRARYWPLLRREVIKLQQKDGSIWDYDMHRYDRPYGVSFGLMALDRSLTP